MKTSSFDGTHIHYQTVGELGPPVVMIMGFTMRGLAWEEIAERLADDHRVVIYDNRGVGESDVPRGPYSMSMMARDALAVMEAVGFEQAHVVGVSMGGMIAQELAIKARERLKSLTLIATHAGGRGPILPTRKGLSQFVRGNLARTPQTRLEAVERLLFPQAYLERCDRERLRARLRREFGHNVELRGRLSQLAAVMRHNTRDRLPRLEGLDTLLVRPGQDLLIRPQEMDRIHTLIPGSRLARFDEAGHGIIRQHPDTLSRVLREHFDR